MTIAWKLDVRVSDLTVRSWTFLPKENDPFAKILRDGDVLIQTQYSPGPFAITKPSTLILKNVTIQYNGTYTFTIYAKGEFTESVVHVFVTGRYHLYNIYNIPYYPIFHHQIAHNFQALTNCYILIGSDNYNRHCHTKCVDNTWTDLIGCCKSFDRDGGLLSILRL